MTRPFAGLLLLSLAITVVGCTRENAPEAAAPEPGSPATPTVPEVVVATPSTDKIEVRIEAPGTFLPFEEAVISAEGIGPIVTIAAEEGTRVARGAVLVQLDPVKAELAVRQAEAALAQAKANFDKARNELSRKQVLLEDRTIAPASFEGFKAQHDAAAAAVDAADSALQLARRRVRDLTVTAPFAGVVKEKRASVGEYVREGDDLLVLMRVDPLKLQFELPERYAGRVAEGAQVESRIVSVPSRSFRATIRTIFPSVAVQSRTIRVEALLANPGYELKPGFFATVMVPISSAPGSLTVPREAVIRREGTTHVFVLDGERVILQPVQIGAESSDRMEIVSGLSPQARIVVRGTDTLADGDRVRVRS